MNYNRPQGCQAAVTVHWETTPPGFFKPGKYKLVAQLMCGERQTSCSDEFIREFANINGEYHSKQVEARVGHQTAELLGAMCMGCPFREQLANSQLPQPE